MKAPLSEVSIQRKERTGRLTLAQPENETMLTRKEMKKRGKRSLKQHYLIFMAACLIAAFLGAEFKSSLNFSSMQTYEQIGEDPSGNIEYSVSSPGWTVSWDDVLMQIADKDTEAGRELSEQLRQDAIQKSEQGNPMFGRTRGVLSDLVNQITSGSIIVTAVAAIGSITGSDNLGIVILILCGVIVYFLFWFLIQNLFPVVIRRIFLEGLTYSQVTPQRFIFLLRVKKWLKASWIMLVTYTFYTLWSLTIVGAFIKRYSYFLVPYIVAENPDMNACQAVTLSRKMMKGHKWECFVFELSFLGWSILGSLTLGIFNIFFTNPYKTAAFTQYYAQLRALAREKQIPGSEMLYDWYLYEKPDPALLREKYADVYAVTQQPPDPDGDLTGWRGFLARNLGLLLFTREEEREYERRQAEHVRIHALIDDMQGLAYPVRFYPIPEEDKRKLVQSLNYMRHYTIWSLIVIFLGLAIFGWVWEVSLHLITDGEFVNRGALYGPWLPIYGTGSILILTLLTRLRRNPALEFTATIVVCGFLEYMTSVFMEFTSGGLKWWDYSGYFLNLNGRICAEGLLVFGIGGIAVVYVIAPIIDNALMALNEKKLRIICIALMAVFLVDFAYSQVHPNAGEGITDYKAEAEELPVRSERG